MQSGKQFAEVLEEYTASVCTVEAIAFCFEMEAQFSPTHWGYCTRLHAVRPTTTAFLTDITVKAILIFCLNDRIFKHLRGL